MVKRPATFAILLAILALGTDAAANPLDTFGYTSRIIAMGGAGTAAAGSYDAAYYNPAGLGLLQGTELGIGASLYRPFLHVRSHAVNASTGVLEQVRGTREAALRSLYDVGIASPIPLGPGLGRILFVGLNLTVPGTKVYSLQSRPRTEPTFPLLEERNRRLVLNAALALRWKWAMIGAGFSVLPDISGKVGVDFRDAGEDNSVDVGVSVRLAPNVGLLFEPIPGLTLGLAWRGGNRTWLSLPVSMTAAGGATIDARILAYDWSTPHELAVGAAWQTGRFFLTADFTWSFFRDFRQPSPSVALGSGASPEAAWQPDPPWHDAGAVRLGAEFRVIPALPIRAGFGWVQSPVPEQTAASNLLDGDRLTGSLGLGFDAAGIGGPAIQVDVHVTYTGIIANRSEKLMLAPGNPGYPFIEGGGSLIGAGLSAKVRF